MGIKPINESNETKSRDQCSFNEFRLIGSELSSPFPGKVHWSTTVLSIGSMKRGNGYSTGRQSIRIVHPVNLFFDQIIIRQSRNALSNPCWMDWLWGELLGYQTIGWVIFDPMWLFFFDWFAGSCDSCFRHQDLKNRRSNTVKIGCTKLSHLIFPDFIDCWGGVRFCSCNSWPVLCWNKHKQTCSSSSVLPFGLRKLFQNRKVRMLL